MDNIKDVVTQVMGQLCPQEVKKSKNIDDVFNRILSDQEKKHVQLSGMKEGKLFVHVDSSAWLFQMKTKQRRLLGEIQQDIPEIQNIYFKIGKVK